MSLLTVRDLTAGYGTHTVLRDVSLDLERGALTALVGHNGAGKTTLLGGIAGVVPRVRGLIDFDGVRVLRGSAYSRPRGLGIVPQGRAVFPSLTVRENLELGQFADSGASPAQRRGRLDAAASYLPMLRERWHDRAGTLSGGQQQMVSIGRALAAGASCLLLDEPSVGLAPVLVENMMRVFATLRDDGLTIVLVEQNVHAAMAIADRIMVMKAGAIIADSTPDAFESDDTLWALF